MKRLRYTLVSDGPSDAALMPILTWLLENCGVALPITPVHADFRGVRYPPKGLAERIIKAVELFDCDLLFVHRDAEKQPPEHRFSEIRTAEAKAGLDRELPPIVGVVPVRMTEAFLLFDEPAIRRAAGNPNGSATLSLPRLTDVEADLNPKETLYQALRVASELKGRRLKDYSVRGKAVRIAQLIEDFSPLRALSSFQRLESDISQLVRDRNWIHP